MKLFSIIFLSAYLVISSFAQDPINIGSRLELFVDDYLIDELSDGARLILQHPTPQMWQLSMMNPGKATVAVTTVSLKTVIYSVCTTRRASLLPSKVTSTGRTRYSFVTLKATTVFTGASRNLDSSNSTGQRKTI